MRESPCAVLPATRRPCYAACLAADDPTAIADLGTNFFLHSKDVGHPRAPACVDKVGVALTWLSLPPSPPHAVRMLPRYQLQSLNKSIQVVAHDGVLTESLVAAHTVVVFTRGCASSVLATALCSNDRRALFPGVCAFVARWMSS